MHESAIGPARAPRAARHGVYRRGPFRAGLDEFFDDSQVVEVDAGGLVSPVLSRIRFARLPRPVYPLDPETTWTPPRG